MEGLDKRERVNQLPASFYYICGICSESGVVIGRYSSNNENKNLVDLSHPADDDADPYHVGREHHHLHFK